MNSKQNNNVWVSSYVYVTIINKYSIITAENNINLREQLI